MRGLLILFVAAGLVTTCNASRSLAQSMEVTLTKEEAEAVKSILAKDRMLKQLTAAQRGLEALNRLLSRSITGPVKLALVWNQGAIAGWRTANDNLAKIGQQAICEDISFRIIEQTLNRDFFEKLYQARGCDA